ncbi:MAG: hypothetical protein VW715_17160 [Rhodospirillales bacterium]|jgi:hypothetical protein
MTNQEMIREMLDRLQRQQEVMASTFTVIEALDRDGDFDLNDQMATADGLLEGLGGLIDRMQKING